MLGRGLQMGFEVVGDPVARGGVAALRMVVGNEVADFELALGQAGKTRPPPLRPRLRLTATI